MVEKNVSGKKIRSSSFKYDGKGNLIFAENSDGKKIKLGYDRMGRIIRIFDGEKTPVILKYEEKFGKPSEISRKNLGVVTISYGAQGEISAVESRNGPLTAEQITESYNNLLSIIAPAAQNIY